MKTSGQKSYFDFINVFTGEYIHLKRNNLVFISSTSFYIYMGRIKKIYFFKLF